MASPTLKSYFKAGFGVMGGAIAAQLIYMAIGLILFLIGMRMLAGARKEGKSPVDAIYQASLLRFRPIMMTTMAALLGALPLAVGLGEGA